MALPTAAAGGRAKAGGKPAVPLLDTTDPLIEI